MLDMDIAQPDGRCRGRKREQDHRTGLAPEIRSGLCGAQCAGILRVLRNSLHLHGHRLQHRVDACQRIRYHHLAPTARLHSAKRRAAFIPLSAICSYFICGASFRCRVDLRYSSSVWLTTELSVLESASPTSCSSSRIALVRLG